LPYQLVLADAVLAAHVGVVVFVVAGLLLVIAGNARHWRWVNHLGFRLAHLAAISVVVAQSWFDITCPLTALETWLRTSGGGSGYSGSFVGHWLQRLLYYDAPPWVFILVYSMFGLAVVASWWYFPPAWPRARTSQ
jgi:hypothetical protein